MSIESLKKEAKVGELPKELLGAIKGEQKKKPK